MIVFCICDDILNLIILNCKSVDLCFDVNDMMISRKNIL